MLFKLLALPITAPLAGVAWVGEKIHETAIKKMNDPTEMKRQLAALERKLEAGELGEAEFEALELEILTRLREASRLMRLADAKG
jgi:Gas vesicle protein G